MRRIAVFLVAVGMVVAFGGVVLAGNGGECGSVSHVNQVTLDKSDASKTVATPSQEKVDTDKIVLVQTNQAVKPVAETKK